jgi:hypothetical protein
MIVFFNIHQGSMFDARNRTFQAEDKKSPSQINHKGLVAQLVQL